MRRSNSTIYVGNLPGDVRESEIEDLFYKYGRIIDIDLKLPPRPPGYCFIEFENARDAEDAIRGRDGYKFDGHRLRVERAHGGRASSVDVYDSYSSGSHSSGLHRRTGYRVIVHGLPTSASWQDLKDHMRRAGDVCFSQVYRKGSGTVGVVDYTSYEDMKYAVRKLDDSEFRNPFARSYIRVREDKGYRSSYSRSRSRSYSRSPSNDYRRRGYRGRSYSRSHSRSFSDRSARSYDSRRSGSLSRSRSPSVYSRSRSRSVSKNAYSPSRKSYSRSISRSRSRSSSRSRSGASSYKKSISRSRSRSLSTPHTKRRSISASRSPSRSRSRSRSELLLPQGKARSRSGGSNRRSRSPRSDSPKSEDDSSPRRDSSLSKDD